MQYKFYSEGRIYKRNVNRELLKLLEAEHRGLRLDYEITYPDGGIQQCKFIKK